MLADARHPPPASPILFRPIATTRQWLASEMEAVPLAMEAENLEMTVFLTRHSHLNPHVSQRFQRSLPDLGRSLSQESTSSQAQPRLYSPHMPIHRIFAQEPFGTVHRGKKLRMICIRWQHKPLIPAHSEHTCDVLTVRECFDKVNDNFRLYLCVVIQQNNRLLQCPLPLLSCRRPPFTLFRFRLFLSGRSRSGGFELFGHEVIPDGGLFSFQTITFSPFPFGPHPGFGGLAVKRNIVSAHAFTQPPEQPSAPHGTHSILQGHPGHDRRGLIRAQASSGQLWLKNRLGHQAPACAQLGPSSRLVAISRSALWRRATPSAIVSCDCTRRRPPAAQRTSWQPIGGWARSATLCQIRTYAATDEQPQQVGHVRVRHQPAYDGHSIFCSDSVFPGIQT